MGLDTVGIYDRAGQRLGGVENPTIDGEMAFTRTALDVDREGFLYAVSAHRVLMFTPEGQFLRSFGGNEQGVELSFVGGCAVDEQGRVYLAEREQGLVYVYADRGHWSRLRPGSTCRRASRWTPRGSSRSGCRSTRGCRCWRRWAAPMPGRCPRAPM